MEMFGNEAMEDVLKAHMNSDRENLCEVMLQAVKEFSGDAVQSDDITMLMLRILGEKTHRYITFQLADEYSYEYRDGRNILKVRIRYNASL